MLVLSRKKNESIVINNEITIVVVEIRGDKVRLGVEAPKEVPVHRREVYDAIKRAVDENNSNLDAHLDQASPRRDGFKCPSPRVSNPIHLANEKSHRGFAPVAFFVGSDLGGKRVSKDSIHQHRDRRTCGSDYGRCRSPRRTRCPQACKEPASR